MKRRQAIGMIAAAAFGGSWLSRVVHAQPAGRVMRVAFEDVMSPRSPAPAEYGQPAFDVAAWFAAEGFAEGRNLVLEPMGFYELLKKDEGWGQRMREIVASRPDVILVVGAGGPYPRWLKRMTSEIPIIFYSLAVDPVRLGLVESLRRPGGNVTGTMGPLAEVAMTKGWELLKELRPTARRIGALVDRAGVNEMWMPDIRASQIAAAGRLGLERIEILVSIDETFASAERAIRSARVDLLDPGFPASGLNWPWHAELLRFLERSGTPALWIEADVKIGGLVSIDPSAEEMGREAVRIVAKVLRGEKPATIPVYVSTRYRMTINLRTARAMKLTIPQSILLRAEKVYE